MRIVIAKKKHNQSQDTTIQHITNEASEPIASTKKREEDRTRPNPPPQPKEQHQRGRPTVDKPPLIKNTKGATTNLGNRN